MYHHDPAQFLRRIRVPLLAIIGDLDHQVPAGQSLPAFESLYSGQRRRLLTVHRMPGINHMMQRAKHGSMEEYMSIEETMASAVLARIDEWLARVAPTATLRGGNPRATTHEVRQ
jgi:uncharacterized protein